MTKTYHLTQEQAEAIAEKVGMQYTHSEEGVIRDGNPEQWTDLINAALDEVLGEPVGVIKDEMRGEDGAELHYALLFKHLPLDTKLYAPKGMTLCTYSE
jgi:hypothetical protein